MSQSIALSFSAVFLSDVGFCIFDRISLLLEVLEYDAFGVLVRSEVGKIKDSTVSYTEYEYEESTGLYYAKARYYQAEVAKQVLVVNQFGKHSQEYLKLLKI